MGSVARVKMATFNVVICQKRHENGPAIEESEIYLCLATWTCVI